MLNNLNKFRYNQILHALCILVVGTLLVFDSALLATGAKNSTNASESYTERFDRAEILMKKGVALGRQKKYSESVAELKKAVELIPDNGPLLYNLGMSLYNAGDLGEARKAWQKTVSLRPDYADAWYMLGLLDAKEGNSADAISALIKCVELKPQENDAKAALIKECLKVARKNYEQLAKTDLARAKKLTCEFPTNSALSVSEGKHPLANTEIPGTGKTFDELLEIFKRIPFQPRTPSAHQK